MVPHYMLLLTTETFMPFMSFKVKQKRRQGKTQIQYPPMTPKKKKFTDLSHRVIGSAIEVHRHLGPGLLESTYQQCLARELHLSGIPFKLEYPLGIWYHRKGCMVPFVENRELLVQPNLESVNYRRVTTILTQGEGVQKKVRNSLITITGSGKNQKPQRPCRLAVQTKKPRNQ